MKRPIALASALCLILTPLGVQAAVRPAKAKPAAAAAQTPARGVERQTFLYATKDGQKLYLDRYVGKARTPGAKKPVLIFSFGGGWETGERNDFNIADFANYFAERGFDVVSIDYRLGVKAAKAKGELKPSNGVEIYLKAVQWGVEDLFDATSYVAGQGASWNIDTSKVVIVGSSAGATNSLVAIYNQANQTELAKAHLPDGFRFGGAIAMAGAFWLPANTPLTWKTAPPPMQFFHGAKDQLVTYTETQDGFSGYGPVAAQKSLSSQGYSSWFVDIPQADHVMSVAPMIDYRLEIEAFLDKMVLQGQSMTIHTVETDQVPKTFPNLMKLYGPAFQAAKARAQTR